MTAKKSYRIGERNVNHQGLTMEIVKYVNNKNVEIVFLETGERKVVRYANFCNRTVKANLMDYPFHIVAKTKKLAKITKYLLLVIGIVGVLAITLKLVL